MGFAPIALVPMWALLMFAIPLLPDTPMCGSLIFTLCLVLIGLVALSAAGLMDASYHVFSRWRLLRDNPNLRTLVGEQVLALQYVRDEFVPAPPAIVRGRLLEILSESGVATDGDRCLVAGRGHVSGTCAILPAVGGTCVRITVAPIKSRTLNDWGRAVVVLSELVTAAATTAQDITGQSPRLARSKAMLR